MFPVADKDLGKYLKKLIGRRNLEDALSRLEMLTQEEAWMATVQVLKVAHRVDDRVRTVGDKGDVAIEGTLSASATHKRHRKLIYN